MKKSTKRPSGQKRRKDVKPIPQPQFSDRTIESATVHPTGIAIDIDAITRKLVANASDGDAFAARLIFDRYDKGILSSDPNDRPMTVEDAIKQLITMRQNIKDALREEIAAQHEHEIEELNDRNARQYKQIQNYKEEIIALNEKIADLRDKNPNPN